MAFVAGSAVNVGQGYGGMVYPSNRIMTSTNSWQGAIGTTGISNGPILYECVKSGVSGGTRMIAQWKSQTSMIPSSESELSIFEEQSSRITEIR
jgi:hypothetical protein